MTDDIREALESNIENLHDPDPMSLVAEAQPVLPSDVDPEEVVAVAKEVLGDDTDDSAAETEHVTDYEIEEGIFPAELLLQDRWFVWAMDNGRKIPRAPWSDDHTEETYASWKNEDIWTDFDTADEWVDSLSGYGHASCIPTYEDNSVERLIFFDFDDARNPDTGEIHNHVWSFIDEHGLSAYLSTSGTGVHAFGWGRLPEGYKVSFERELPDWEYGDDVHLEVYAGARFIALTGEHIAGTPVSVPDLNETSVELFEQFGTERQTGPEREPDVSREAVQDIDTTTDISDIYDAIAHTRPSDIRLRSTETESYSGRDANRALNPSWANSESGTRLAEFDDHWLYRKGNVNLDALQVVALEERIILTETEYPEGEDFWDAVEALRDRGAHIPELETQSVPAIPPSSADAPDASDQRADTAETDGGETETDNSGSTDTDSPTPPEPGADPEPDAVVDDANETDGSDDDDSAWEDWHDIRTMFRNADSADERATPRFESAMKIHREHSFANLQENEVLYCYNEEKGIYEPNGRQVIREHLTNGLEEQYRAQVWSDAEDHIRGRTTIPQDAMGGPEGVIAARNCVIDLKNDRRVEHSPDHRFLSRLGCDYDPDAECPQWRAFLSQSVSSDIDRAKLQEFAGYCLHHWGLPFHKSLFLVGPTASGKSTFLDTINALLGDDTVASLTPQQLTGERFAPAELYGKWANIRNDIPKSTVENTGMFKELIAGDPMKAEEKNKDPFFFNPTAKHLFSANQLPEMNVDDEAFFRRVLLVAFPETVPEPERDKRLDEKLQNELPGILNWAIEGLQRLLGNGKFTGDKSPGYTRETWSKWGDSVERFAKVAITNGDDSIPKDRLYAAYLQYCREESIPTDTQSMMTRQLKKEGFQDDRAYIDGEQRRCFVGINWTGRGESLVDAAQSDDDPDDSDVKGSGSAGIDSF